MKPQAIFQAKLQCSYLEEKLKTSWISLPCLVCGVDSKPVFTFFIWLIGGGLLASLAVLLWAKSIGMFSPNSSVEQKPLQLEANDHEH